MYQNPAKLSPTAKRCVTCKNWHTRPEKHCVPCADEHRLKVNARHVAGAHFRKGHLKPEPCLHCGAKEVEKHHYDYSQPLDVTWLCRPCHTKEERKLRRERAEKKIKEIVKYLEGLKRPA